MVTFTNFEKRYLSKEDHYKYEWMNGVVVKSKRTLTQNHLYLVLNLEKYSQELNGKGRFYTEVETWFGKSYRCPNVSYFSGEQSQMFGKANQVPQLLIEIITKDCRYNIYNLKLIDYRNAKVPIVWFVFPKTKEVHVYRGKQMTICSGDDICSAEPVIPGFLIPASKVFE